MEPSQAVLNIAQIFNSMFVTDWDQEMKVPSIWSQLDMADETYGNE